MEIQQVELVEKCKIRNLKTGVHLNSKKILRVNNSIFWREIYLSILKASLCYLPFLHGHAFLQEWDQNHNLAQLIGW